LKILIISTSFYPKIDGSTRCVYDHARKLAERGHTVYLLTRGVKGAKRTELFEGIRVVRTATSFRSSTPLSKARLVFDEVISAFRLQRQVKFDVIHVHGCAAGLAALPTKYVLRVPLVITTHGTELLWPRELWWKDPTELKLDLMFERFVLNRCDVVIAQSKGVRDYMVRFYGRGISKKIRLVPTGVDHEKFATKAKSSGDPGILFVGALSEVKGVGCLLKAFSKVQSEVPSSKLVLVGSGPNTDGYKKRASELRLNGSVQFSGAVRDDGKLLELYNESDVVVLPSNVGGPISCTLLEGMSCGKAVISTNVPGGIPDVLGDDAGILIEREDDKGLAEQLTKLVTDPDYLARFQLNARRAVVEKYTLETMTDNLTQLYREIAK
jgi:glycosyltransferase involved in cell wall biosynthesis